MQYQKVAFEITDQDMNDMLIAILADAGYNGFEEQDSKLLAYIEAPQFQENELKEIACGFSTSYTTELISSRNWNAAWESNFEPVVVNGFCTIRAHFHNMEVTTPYDIVITPKMSFGTGHHATTQLMIRMMKDLDIKGKSVLDFGTGTGVLAIFAEMLGASAVLAIDNDAWSVENAIENIHTNNCEKITVRLGSLETDAESKVDVILANINRHILLQYMQSLFHQLNSDGIILMSGLLTDDKDIIVKKAVDTGFSLLHVNEQANWIAILLKKI